MPGEPDPRRNRQLLPGPIRRRFGLASGRRLIAGPCLILNIVVFVYVCLDITIALRARVCQENSRNYSIDSPGEVVVLDIH